MSHLRTSGIRALRQQVLVRPVRNLSTARPAAMVASKDLSISKGHDGDAIAQGATRLVDEGRWQLCNNGKGLERQFKFKTFKTTWEFMDRVAGECTKQKHHPEWTNVYNRTHIRWTTHNPEGLSSKDTAMARFCDEAAEDFGELPLDSGDTKLQKSERVSTDDCCVPKGKTS